METIFHYFIIHSSKETVAAAVSSLKGISNWWSSYTRDTGDNSFEVGFGDNFIFVFEKLLPVSPDHIIWVCKQGPAEWVNTRIEFHIEPVNESPVTVVRFKHSGWTSKGDFFGECNFQWGLFLKSLRSYCETGTGAPFSAGYQDKSA